MFDIDVLSIDEAGDIVTLLWGDAIFANNYTVAEAFMKLFDEFYAEELK